VVEFLCPLRKIALEEKRRLILSRVVANVRRAKSKIITVHPLHPKLLTLTLTLNFLSENPSLKITRSKKQTENFPRKNYQRVQEHIPPLPLFLNEMYQKLLSIEQVAPVPLTPLRPPYPSWYKPHITCEYHASAAGHNIHTYNAFKKKLL
jgi:hypothetical protein